MSRRLPSLYATVLCAVLFSATPALQAQSKREVGMSPPELGAAFHAERRKTLMARVGGGVIVVRGARNPNDYMRFRQAHNFIYLSGVRDPDCELLLVPETGEEILIVPPRNRFREEWEGRGVLPGAKGEAATGVAKVIPGTARTLLREIKSALERCGDSKRVFVEFAPEEEGAASRDLMRRGARAWKADPLDGRLTRHEALVAKLRAALPETEIADLSPALDRMRTIKLQPEIELLGYAARLASIGIAEAMKACRPGQREYELAAVADYTYRRHGAEGIGYMPIVGSGPNGCVLHYWRNDRVMKKGELVVMDFAPQVKGYTADVTRTFPVGGKFSPAARKLVQDVWDAQKAILDAIKPGVSFGSLYGIGNKVLLARGYKPRIHIKHGPSHHLGMAVHDVSAGSRALEEGMVLTVEPGVYLVDKAMGCRIEDDIVVTASGYELLSKGCPSDPDGIERLMKRKGLAQTPDGK